MSQIESLKKRRGSRGYYLSILGENRPLELASSPLSKSPSKNTNTNNTDTLNIAIVGAGISGLYAALLLLDLEDDQQKPISVSLFEASNRVGGRLLTHKLQCEEEEEEDFADDYVDAGAMRVPDIEDMNRILGTQEPENVFFDRGLVPYLDAHRAGPWKNKCLKILEYHLSDPFGNNVSYYNGFKVGENGHGLGLEEIVYPKEILDKNADAVIHDEIFKVHLTSLEEDFDVALRRIVEKYDKHSMRSYIQEYKREWNGAAIDYLESMQTASGLYDRSFVEMLLDYFDFQTSHPTTHPTPKAKHSICCEKTIQWKTLDGGFEQLALRLDALLSEQFPSRYAVSLNCKVDRIWSSDSLSLAIGSKEFHNFDHVILTNTLGTIRSMDFSALSPALGYQKAQGLRLLRYCASTKVMLHFGKQFWRKGPDGTEKTGIHGGQNTTDGPVRCVAYPSHGKFDSPGWLIASYTWDQDAQRMTPNQGSELEIVRLCLKGLEQFHSHSEIHENYTGEYFIKAWESDALMKGAFACYGPQQFSTLYEAIKEPAVDGKLHFAGEAVDVHHAWIIGSLCSAYRTVDEIFLHEGRAFQRNLLRERWGEIQDLDKSCCIRDCPSM